MSGFRIDIGELEGGGQAFIQKANAGITGGVERVEFMGYIARSVEETTRKHVRTIAPARHFTADDLGGRRTGFLERAARSIESDADANGAYLVFPRNFGLQRAFGPVTIKPRPGRKYLTIPATAEAYGKRAGELPGLKFQPLGKVAALVREDTAGEPEVVYWLVKAVNQRQDRGLMPSNADFAKAALEGAEAFIRSLPEE